MGCGNCNVATSNGKPAGCQSNGNCSSGGCNKMNVFNWLADLPSFDIQSQFSIVEISFNQGSRKDFFHNSNRLELYKGQNVAVEGVSGFDVGEVSLVGELVKLQLKKHGISKTDELKKILRTATEKDVQLWTQAKAKEREILIQGRVIARQLNLEMKISEAELQADGKKVTFFYTADERVDFRELIKLYASEFKSKIEMRQIGARQESAKVGGIGSCGRELCCSSWLTDFKTVYTGAARYQNLSINQAKLSGQCGRLKCCLNYELDTYMDALKEFPEHADMIEVGTGRLFLQKKDIFKNLMWYAYQGSNKLYPLSITKVEEILALNKKGIKPEELEPEEVTSTSKIQTDKAVMGFVNDVGQLTLSSISRSSKKHKSKRTNEDRRVQTSSSPNKPSSTAGAQQQRQQQKSRPSNSGGARPTTANPNRPNNNRPNNNRPGGNNNQQNKSRQNPPK